MLSNRLRLARDLKPTTKVPTPKANLLEHQWPGRQTQNEG